VVDIVPDKPLPRAVTLAEIKSDKAFASFPLVRMSRLSVMPVTDAEWDRIETLSRSERSERSDRS
jgi:predicted RNA-binding protein with PUA-like domain